MNFEGLNWRSQFVHRFIIAFPLHVTWTLSFLLSEHRSPGSRTLLEAEILKRDCCSVRDFNLQKLPRNSFPFFFEEPPQRIMLRYRKGFRNVSFCPEIELVSRLSPFICISQPALNSGSSSTEEFPQLDFQELLFFSMSPSFASFPVWI